MEEPRAESWLPLSGLVLAPPALGRGPKTYACCMENGGAASGGAALGLPFLMVEVVGVAVGSLAELGCGVEELLEAGSRVGLGRADWGSSSGFLGEGK